MLCFSSKLLDLADTAEKHGGKMFVRYFCKKAVDRYNDQLNSEYFRHQLDPRVKKLIDDLESLETVDTEESPRSHNKSKIKFYDSEKEESSDVDSHESESGDETEKDTNTKKVTYDILLREFGEKETLKIYLGDVAPFWWPYLRLGYMANREPHCDRFYILLANSIAPILESFVEAQFLAPWRASQKNTGDLLTPDYREEIDKFYREFKEFLEDEKKIEEFAE